MPHAHGILIIAGEGTIYCHKSLIIKFLLKTLSTMATLQTTMTLHSPSPSNNSLPNAISFIDRAKSSGRCTPSLLPNSSELNHDASFYAFVSNLIADSSSHGACSFHAHNPRRFLEIVSSFLILTLFLSTFSCIPKPHRHNAER